MAIEEWTRVASAGEVKPGELKQVVIGDDEVVLANAEGEFLAASDVCSHEYVLLHDGWLEDHEVECPQHGSRFDLRSGEVRNLPATEPVPTYDVKVEGSDIYIKGPKENQ
jgi:nitrite reductase/ring-hydroxylating ferredoxin subunit